MLFFKAFSHFYSFVQTDDLELVISNDIQVQRKGTEVEPSDHMELLRQTSSRVVL